MNTGVGCRFLLQGIFPTQGANPGLPHCRQTLYCLSYQECQTRPNSAPPPHTHIQKLYSLSPVYFQNLAQCLAQADAQKLFNKSTSAGLNVNLKRGALLQTKSKLYLSYASAGYFQYGKGVSGSTKRTRVLLIEIIKARFPAPSTSQNLGSGLGMWGNDWGRGGGRREGGRKSFIRPTPHTSPP